MVRRDVWVVEVFLLLGRVTHAAAGTAALEAVAAFATARQATASATDNAPKDGENDEATNNNHGDHWPLAVGSLHAVVPTRKGRLYISDRR